MYNEVHIQNLVWIGIKVINTADGPPIHAFTYKNIGHCPCEGIDV